jgi:hypothetical protein
VSAIEREKAQAAAIGREFPGWEAWVGISGMWHARRLGAVPSYGDFLTGEDEVDLRDQIRRWIGRQP